MIPYILPIHVFMAIFMKRIVAIVSEINVVNVYFISHLIYGINSYAMAQPVIWQLALTKVGHLDVFDLAILQCDR